MEQAHLIFGVVQVGVLLALIRLHLSISSDKAQAAEQHGRDRSDIDWALKQVDILHGRIGTLEDEIKADLADIKKTMVAIQLDLAKIGK